MHRRAVAMLVPEDSVKIFNFSRGKRGVHVYEEDKHMRDRSFLDSHHENVVVFLEVKTHESFEVLLRLQTPGISHSHTSLHAANLSIC